MSDNLRLEPGTSAPQFTAPNQEGKSVSLSDFAGQKVILYFYPQAETPACSKQANDLNDNLDELRAAGFSVVGVSPDTQAKLAKFKQKQGLKFDLLSDPEHEVHKLYGAYGEKSMYGRIYQGVIRSTFVIDADGKIALALYGVKATGHANMLKKQLGLA